MAQLRGRLPILDFASLCDFCEALDERRLAVQVGLRLRGPSLERASCSLRFRHRCQIAQLQFDQQHRARPCCLCDGCGRGFDACHHSIRLSLCEHLVNGRTESFLRLLHFRPPCEKVVEQMTHLIHRAGWHVTVALPHWLDHRQPRDLLVAVHKLGPVLHPDHELALLFLECLQLLLVVLFAAEKILVERINHLFCLCDCTPVTHA
mmetsp:Transcript_12615/g.32008  ORF Transcript_12615/g.32008 Transcript_12615/m.32008 type:complete len:206 (+) Transcript_12615:738-1355(+)